MQFTLWPGPLSMIYLIFNIDYTHINALKAACY